MLNSLLKLDSETLKTELKVFQDRINKHEELIGYIHELEDTQTTETKQQTQPNSRRGSD